MEWEGQQTGTWSVVTEEQAHTSNRVISADVAGSQSPTVALFYAARMLRVCKNPGTETTLKD